MEINATMIAAIGLLLTIAKMSIDSKKDTAKIAEKQKENYDMQNKEKIEDALSRQRLENKVDNIIEQNQRKDKENKNISKDLESLKSDNISINNKLNHMEEKINLLESKQAQ